MRLHSREAPYPTTRYTAMIPITPGGVKARASPSDDIMYHKAMLSPPRALTGRRADASPHRLTESDVRPADSAAGLELGQDGRQRVLLLEEALEALPEALRHDCGDENH